MADLGVMRSTLLQEQTSLKEISMCADIEEQLITVLERSMMIGIFVHDLKKQERERDAYLIQKFGSYASMNACILIELLQRMLSRALKAVLLLQQDVVQAVIVLGSIGKEAGAVQFREVFSVAASKLAGVCRPK